MRFEEYRKHDAISLAEGTDDGAGRAPSRWSSFQPISARGQKGDRRMYEVNTQAI